MMEAFDTAVIGAGMIGSASARHLTRSTDGPNVLIGPSEIQADQSGVFGAWFDEGRITRVFDFSDTWRKLAIASIERYRDIEKDSGISFYHEVGYLTVVRSDYENMEKFHETAELVRQAGFACEHLEKEGLREKFPYLQFPPDAQAYHQPDSSGYINPRELVRAEQELARKAGFSILEDVVEEVLKEEGEYLLLLRSGKLVRCRRMIIANGAYLNISNLLQNLEPCPRFDVSLTGQTVAYIRVSEPDANRLEKMPTLITRYRTGELDGSYILPPIKYPDGNYYIKLGHNDAFERTLLSSSDVEDWYRCGEGDPQAVVELAQLVQQLLPDVGQLSVTGGCCVTAKTPGKLGPILTKVCDSVVVAAGGNGYAAKSCDEIGRIAATLF